MDMQAGTIRQDLYYRINVVNIQLPPLRQRTMDLPVLTDYFLDQHSKAFRRSVKPLSQDMLRLMQRYSWPGNIRQLENMIRSYVLIGNEEALAAELVPVVAHSQERVITEIELGVSISAARTRTAEMASSAR